MRTDPASVDLAHVTSELARVFGGNPPGGYLPGKTAFRDAVTELLGCSQLEAEEIVDTLIACGFLQYEGETVAGVDDVRAWRIIALPSSTTSMLS